MRISVDVFLFVQQLRKRCWLTLFVYPNKWWFYFLFRTKRREIGIARVSADNVKCVNSSQAINNHEWMWNLHIYAIMITCIVMKMRMVFCLSLGLAEVVCFMKSISSELAFIGGSCLLSLSLLIWLARLSSLVSHTWFCIATNGPPTSLWSHQVREGDAKNSAKYKLITNLVGQ